MVLNEIKTTWPPPQHKILYFALSQLLVGILRLFKVLIRTLGQRAYIGSNSDVIWSTFLFYCIHNGCYLDNYLTFCGLKVITMSNDRQSTTHGCYRGRPEAGSDSHVVARSEDFDGRGGDHTAEGGGGVRPLSLMVHHVGCEQYLNLSLMIFQRTVYGMAVCFKRILDRWWIC